VPFGCVLGAWHAHEGELRTYLVHRLGDAQLADDLLQDVFVKAMRQGQGFCTLAQPRAWLFQVARNALIDHARAQRPTEPVDEDLPATDVADVEAVDLLADQLARVLPQLEAADEEILRACDLSGERQQAYADRHGLTLPAVKARLLRARQRLRARLIATCAVRFDEHGSVCCVGPTDPTHLR
jgi:RNA polymerase sigma-70 factor (ECF subfamily)